MNPYESPRIPADRGVSFGELVMLFACSHFLLIPLLFGKAKMRKREVALAIAQPVAYVFCAMPWIARFTQ